MPHFVVTPQRIGAGQLIEIQRSLRADWTELTTDPRRVPITAHREADAHVAEEILAMNGDAISQLSARWAAWREQIVYNGEAHEDLALSGHAYKVTVVDQRVQIASSLADDQRSALEREYATLGAPVPIERMPRVIAAGTTVADIGSLVLALMLRHVRGPGAYVPSMYARVDATLATVSGDIGTFDIAITPVAPSQPEHVRLTGQLALGAEGWPRTLTLTGTCVRTVASRFETTTQNGTLGVSVTWAYS